MNSLFGCDPCIFKDLPGAFAVVAPDLSLQAATKDYVEATMISENASFGRHFFDVFPENPNAPEQDGVATLAASYDRVRRTRKREALGVLRYDIRDREGRFQERYWVPINSPILDRDGKLRWIIHRVEDVTGYFRLKEAADHRQKAEEQLRQDVTVLEAEVLQSTQALRQELEASVAANEATARFLSAASHDLRQPAQAAALFAASLKELPLPPGAAERLHYIETSLEALNRMLSDLLDLSRLDAGQVTPLVRPFRVETLLDKLAAEFQPLAETAGLKFKFAGSRLAVYSDPTLLEQILRNLIANAIKYTAHGAVALFCDTIGGEVRISVCDTGAGIPADQRELIFQDYYRVNSNRQGGLGIGLATVARTAKLLGHRLTVHSRVGHGSIFSVCLPAAEA